MSTTVPYIPENAPFTAEQRAWLNGMLAGMFSSVPALATTNAKASHRIAVLYASQSGTAEGLARKLAKELKAQGHVPAVSTLVGYTPAALAAEKHALLIASTYGEGEAPDGVQPFYEELCLSVSPATTNCPTRYSRSAIGTMSISASSASTSTPNWPRSVPIASATGSNAMWMWTSHSRNGRHH